MYMLKVCRCCDAIIGELEADDFRTSGLEHSVEIVGNVAYTLCSRCMQDLNISGLTYYH